MELAGARLDFPMRSAVATLLRVEFNDTTLGGTDRHVTVRPEPPRLDYIRHKLLGEIKLERDIVRRR